MKWGASEDESEDVIRKLSSSGFLNEARYASLFAENHLRNFRWGWLKIRACLLEKGIPQSIIDTVQKESETEEYFTTLKKLIREEVKKNRNKESIYRKFISRGFEPELVEEILNSLI